MLDEIGSEKALVCYRRLRATAESYNMRASYLTDGWPTGRIDIFAVADAFAFAKTIAENADRRLLFVPHRSLWNDWRSTVDAAHHYLTGKENSELNETALNEIIIRKRMGSSKERLSISNYSERAIKVYNNTGLDAIFNQRSCFLLSDYKDEIKDAASQLPSDDTDFFRSIIYEGNNPDAISYFERLQKNIHEQDDAMLSVSHSANAS